MALVTISGGTGDAGALGDDRPWRLWAAAYQPDGSGGVITTRDDRTSNVLRPVAGVLTFKVEAGVVFDLQNPDKRTYRCSAATDSDLWDVIEAAVAYPPDTDQQVLNAAVAAVAPGLVAEELETQTADAVTADLTDRQLTVTDAGGGAAQFALGGVDMGDPFPLPAATWSGVAGKPADYYHASLVADNTGATDSTTDLQDLLDDVESAGGGTVYFDGTYVTDPLTIHADTRLLLAENATIKLKDNATPAAGNRLAPIIIAGSNVSVVGGVIDANRDGQSQSAYNTLGGSVVQATGGVFAFGTSMAPLTGLDIDTRIINAVDLALRATYVNDSTFDVRIEDSGAGASFSNCDNLSGQGLAFTRIDGSGWKLYPHIIDFTNVTQVRFDQITSVYHGGTGQVGSGTALSNWISGATFLNSHDLAIGSMSFATVTSTNQTKGVGASFLSCSRMRVGNLYISGYSDCLLEMGGVVDSEFTNIDLDGRWQASDVSAGSGVGWKLANYGFYPGLASRSQRFTERNSFTNFTVRRCLAQGMFLTAARRNTFVAGRIFGCRFGARSQWISTDSVDNFTTQLVRDLDGNKWIGVEASYNEEHGFDFRDGANILLSGCRASNNGQAETKGAARSGGSVTTTPSGMYFGTSSAGGTITKTGVVVVAPECTDTQSFTDALSGISANGAVLSALDPEKYVPGQTITLVGAGPAAANLITRVQDVSLDEVTLQDTPSTWPTVAGTGTISSSGVALTGSGTAFATELNARYFITAAGQTRQIIKTASNTAATVSEAFSPALSGASFTISKIVVNGMPSQDYGCYFSADTLAPQMVSGNLEGNVTGRVSDNTSNGANKLRTTSVPGVSTNFLNTLTSDGFVRAYENGGAPSRTILGQVGPSNQGGLGMGATGSGSGADVALYRRAAGVLRSENVIELGNQASPPGTPTGGGVLYAEAGVLKWKGSGGTVTTLGPA